MLINTSDITSIHKSQFTGKETEVCFNAEKSGVFHANKDVLLTKIIGDILPGKTIHFYSWANFNLVKLILFVLKQTGPADILMTSYSFSQKSIESLNSYKKSGLIKNIQVLIDNRVRVMSPKPFQMLISSFDYRCTSVHAKVALIWNEKWNITIVTSQNATDNPKLERGIIFTDKSIFDFDFKTLTDEFLRGTA
ncbi:MAG: hypothetical protein ACOYO1_15695 [Bacteroidales bacterium]